jgi:hypothetical protein
MIYWILSDVAGKHGRRHDGDWEPLERRSPASDEVERFHRHRDAAAKAKKLKAKGCHCKPLKQEGIVLFWRLPERAGESDLAEVIEFKSKRQAAAWQKRAVAEGCEVIECMGTAKARTAKRRGAKK